ncbi:MAG TPA: GatB/YqeY domain-containing protein [Thermotogaceae bacterium]|nr:GatB/YqeY domain-containing protein [Thermotogaceae bacterium]
MTIEELRNKLKEAMKSSDEVRVRTLRLLISNVKNEEIEKGEQLTEEEFTEVVLREVKRRKEAIEMYEKAQRKDLADEERKELKVLEEFLPQQLSIDEIRSLAIEAIESVGASGPKDLGKVMSVLMPKLRGRADGKMVNKIVREFLER